MCVQVLYECFTDNVQYTLDLGKSDQSAAAAAYDSLVNQLLTLMDGLRSTNLHCNTLQTHTVTQFRNCYRL